MSEANKLLLKRWFEQVWNQKSEAAIDEMFNPAGQVLMGFPDADTVLVGPRSLQGCPSHLLWAFPRPAH